MKANHDNINRDRHAKRGHRLYDYNVELPIATERLRAVAAHRDINHYDSASLDPAVRQGMHAQRAQSDARVPQRSRKGRGRSESLRANYKT